MDACIVAIVFYDVLLVCLVALVLGEFVWLALSLHCLFIMV